MSRWRAFFLVVLLFAALPAPRSEAETIAQAASFSLAAGPKQSTMRLQLHIHPSQISVGRDQSLTVAVSTVQGTSLTGVLVTATGAGMPVVGRTRGGRVRLIVHATALGNELIQASLPGFTSASARLAVVPGPPATVAAIKAGLSVLAPNSRPVAGRVGTDLQNLYHALTGKKQYASLAFRDGTLMDLNTDTDVQIKDPLHLQLTAGELFLEVVHGSVSHQVQVGSAVAATKGTRLDVRVDSKTKAAVVTVVEGKVQVTKQGIAVLVGAGSQVVVPVKGPPGRPQPVDLSRTLSWVKNLPNTSTASVPPVLSPAIPPPALVPPPPAPVPATITASDPAQGNWSGVVSVPGSVTVPSGASLTIQPGTVVQMSGGAQLSVQGTLLAVGTAAAPIIFTSAAPDPHPGDWQFISLNGAGATGSRLSYVRTYFGSWNGGDNGMLSVTGGAAPQIDDSIFVGATQYGLWADDGSRPLITNCVFASDASGAISVSTEGAGLVAGTQLGAGQGGIEVRDSTVAHNTVWHRQASPFVVDGGTVSAGATLTIEAGSDLRMAGGAAFHVLGTLLAEGTAAAPIIVTSNTLTPAPGDWQYLDLDGTAASGSKLSFVEMFYGSWNGGDNGMLSVTGGADPDIENSVFAQSTQNGVWADDTSRPTLGNCVFAGDPQFAVSVPADDGTLITGSTVGAAQPGLELRDTAISHSGIWHRQSAPFVLDGGTLNAAVTLTVESGVLLQMAGGAAFHVLGTLLAEGTAAAPIIVTSNTLTPAPGDWQYLDLDGTAASGSKLSFVEMFYGSWNGGDNGMLSVTGGADPDIENSVFAQSTQNGVWADDTSRPTLGNCVFAGDPQFAVSVPADDGTLITGSTVGAAQPGLELRDTAISHSGIWHRQSAPFVLDGGTLNAAVTLTLAAGVEIDMAGGAAFHVLGTLIGQGTAENPVIFSSANQHPAAGQWLYVAIDGAASDRTRLDFVQFWYGSWNGGDNGMLSITGGARPTIVNSLFAQGTGTGIWVDDQSLPTVQSCIYQQLGGPALSIPLADAPRVHDNHLGVGAPPVEVRS